MKLTVLADAEYEYRDAAEWYRSREHGLGDQFLNELELTFQRVEQDPTSLPLLETTQHSKREFRRCSVGTFPYFVVFEVVGDEACVIAVSHAHRHPDYWTDRI